jgi:hypothetical protein
VFALLAALALAAQTHTAAPAACWSSLGDRPAYIPSDQVRDLQTRLKAGGCDVIGVAWSTKTPPQQSLILWDGKQEMLWRVTVEKQAVRWEKWAGASRQRMLADDPADGFTLGARSQGKGRATISPAAGGFVKQRAPGTFDAALPVNCEAPPAADNPPFLTKCGG